MEAEKNVVRMNQGTTAELQDWPELNDPKARLNVHPKAQPKAHPEANPMVDNAPARGPFLPLLLGGLAVLGMLAFQSTLLLMDREALQTSFAAQQQTVDNAGKLRTSLDTLAADTQRMADAGNANARVLVEELKKRGVTITAAVAVPAR